MTAPSDDACGGHPGLNAELRAVLVAALDRVEPAVERLRSRPADAPAATTCAVCPVCAVLAALRGERTELAVQLAEHAAGLLAVLRAAVEEGDPQARAPREPAPAGAPGRRVQHIPVTRPGPHQ